MVLSRFRNKLRVLSPETVLQTNVTESLADRTKTDGTEGILGPLEAASLEASKGNDPKARKYGQKLERTRVFYLQKIKEMQYDPEKNQHSVEIKRRGKRRNYTFSELTFLWSEEMRALSDNSVKDPWDKVPIVFKIPSSKTRYIIEDDTSKHAPLTRNLFSFMGYISRTVKSEIKKYDLKDGVLLDEVWTAEKRVEIAEYFRIWEFLTLYGKDPKLVSVDRISKREDLKTENPPTEREDAREGDN